MTYNPMHNTFVKGYSILKQLFTGMNGSISVNTKEHNKITTTIIVTKISIEKSLTGKCSRLFFHLVRRQELIHLIN